MRVIKNAINVVDVHIGLIHKLNLIIIHAASHLNQRLFAIPRIKLLVQININDRKKIIIAVSECCVVDVASHSKRNLRAEHVPISVGYKLNFFFEYYFGQDYLKSFASDLLTIETVKRFEFWYHFAWSNHNHSFFHLSSKFLILFSFC